MHSIPEIGFCLDRFHLLLDQGHCQLQSMVGRKPSSDPFFIFFLLRCFFCVRSKPCGFPHIYLYLLDYFVLVIIFIRLLRSGFDFARIVSNPILHTDFLWCLAAISLLSPVFCYVHFRPVFSQRRLRSVGFRADFNIITAFAVP